MIKHYRPLPGGGGTGSGGVGGVSGSRERKHVDYQQTSWGSDSTAATTSTAPPLNLDYQFGVGSQFQSQYVPLVSPVPYLEGARGRRRCRAPCEADCCSILSSGVQRSGLKPFAAARLESRFRVPRKICYAPQLFERAEMLARVVSVRAS